MCALKRTYPRYLPLPRSASHCTLREAEGKVKESTTGEAWLAALLILTSIFPPLPPCAACVAADCKEEASYLKQFAAGSSHSLFLVRRYSSFPPFSLPLQVSGGGRKGDDVEKGGGADGSTYSFHRSSILRCPSLSVTFAGDRRLSASYSRRERAGRVNLRSHSIRRLPLLLLSSLIPPSAGEGGRPAASTGKARVAANLPVSVRPFSYVTPSPPLSHTLAEKAGASLFAMLLTGLRPLNGYRRGWRLVRPFNLRHAHHIYLAFLHSTDHHIHSRLAAADGKVTAGKLTFIFSYLCPFYSLPPSPSNSQQAAAVGKGERVKGGFSLTWHCDEKGMPFATVQFEIFIAAAYSRNLDGKTVRVFPYTLGYALYGAEYPILHYTSGKMGLPTKDSPNVHNAARMCAIVRNWLRTAILQWAGQDDGPVWVADEEAWRFSPGKYFNVFIKYPHLEEVRGLPEEIVGDEKEDKDFADVDASVGGEEDEDEDV
ncbi:unnamed protein product [Closterium sp. NIES-65]|nr:unnamed protein product [Closterium sp. NIES-65]